MTRLRLNWVTQISVLTIVVACGSSNNSGVGSANPSTVGGQGATSAVGGTGVNVGGSGASNNGGAGKGTSGTGTAGDNTQAGNGSGTGSTGSTDGGASNVGGDGSVGSNGSVGGDYYSLGGDGYGGTGSVNGGASSIDVKITGGSGSSIDVGSGGGSSVDVATGGGFSIDTGSGGGSSVDIATGGGRTIDVMTGGGSSIDIATGGGSTIDKGTGGGTSVDIPKCLKTDLNNINVYVIKDVTETGSGADTEGNMYVGGNLTAAGYSIGAKDVSCSSNPQCCSSYSLVAGGNVTGVNVYNGKGVAGGTVSASNDTDCGGVIARQGTNLPVNFTTLEAKVEALSTALTQLTPNGTAVKNASGALVLTGTDTKQNVFQIDVSQLGSVTINVPQTSIVIINVSGTTVNWPSGTIALPGGPDSRGDYAFATNVLWNFYEATTFHNTSAAIQGSILAPLATFTGGSGHVAGQVIVKYMTSLAVEFHPYYFSGCITWPTV